MPQSLANVLIHIVFSTKHRQPFLKDDSVRGELHAYAIAVPKSLDSPSLAINSVEDHIHILLSLSRKITIAEIVETLKTSTSKWLKTKAPRSSGSIGNRVTAPSPSANRNAPKVMRYIARQQEHHRRVNYQDEFRQLCAKHGIEIAERYVWD